MRHTFEQSAPAGRLHVQYLQTGIFLPVFFFDHYGHPSYDQKKYTYAETGNVCVPLVALL